MTFIEYTISVVTLGYIYRPAVAAAAGFCFVCRVGPGRFPGTYVHTCFESLSHCSPFFSPFDSKCVTTYALAAEAVVSHGAAYKKAKCG